MLNYAQNIKIHVWGHYDHIQWDSVSKKNIWGKFQVTPY